jgi:two-component system NtrC family sensor kinase
MLGYQRSVREKNLTLARQGLELERWARELERRVQEKQHELETAHDQLLAAEKLAATGRLAAGLAHEINNPLASIAGYAEDLLELSRDEELRATESFRDFPDSLRTIEEQAYRCKRILNQLLSFARPAPFEARPRHLGPIVHGVLPLVEHRARGRDIALLLDLDPELGPALVDRANLEHVLVNLIENAFDAIEGPTGRITVATRPGPGGMQAIEVRDTGKGMGEEDRRRVFDPFFTTKPVGDGTGLGLSICHAVVTRMRGSIDVRSEPGRGAAFTVLLPAAEAGASALPVAAA